MVPSRVCPLSHCLDSPNHGKFHFCGRRYTYPAFRHRMNECVIHKCFNGAWNSNQYSNPTKVHFDRNDSEKEINDVDRKFLTFKNYPDPDPQFTKQLGKLTQSYRIFMEEMSAKLDEWLKLRQTNIHSLQKILQEFSLLKITITGITLVSSTLEFVVGFGTRHFDMFSKYNALIEGLSFLSVTSSFAVFRYSKDSLFDITSELRKEKYLLRDIETVLRRANWIDKELQELFPHGIDLELVWEQAFDANENLVERWDQVVCSAILSANVEKDEKLKYDRKFLASVEAFVRSTAAQIWINRMKLPSLLDYVYLMDSIPKKIYGSEVFAHLAALNLFPLFFSLFIEEEEFKFVWNLSVISSILIHKYTRGYENMEVTSTKLQKVYEHVKKIRNLAESSRRL